MQIPFGDAGSDRNDALKAASAPLRRNGGDQQREKKCKAGSQSQAAPRLRGNGFDIGERIGQADSAARKGHGYIEKWNPNGGAAPLVAADFSSQGCDEFRPGGMIFHGSGVRF